MQHAKYAEVAEILRQRLHGNVYAYQEFPSERKLAGQMGISYMTARKAVQTLIEQGLLQRQENSRLQILAGHACTALNIGFLSPAADRSAQYLWQYDLSRLVRERNGVLRPISYADENDPVIFEALNGNFDGLFLILPANPLPALLTDKLTRMRGKVVVLWKDMTHLGIPSIETAPARFVGKLLDYLVGMGHRRIDCLNTELPGSPVQARVEHWQIGLEKRGLTGRLHSGIVPPEQSSRHYIREMVGRLIENGEISASALFCATTPQAWAALCAFHDHGIQVGRDISLCGFGEMDIAQFLIPSLTAVEPVDRKPYLALGLEWIATGGKDWNKPLRLEPEDVSIFIGASTTKPA